MPKSRASFYDIVFTSFNTTHCPSTKSVGQLVAESDNVFSNFWKLPILMLTHFAFPF